MSLAEESPPKARRRLLAALTAALGAMLGAAAALPGLAFLAHPLRRDTVRGGRGPLRVAGTTDLVPGEPVKCDVRGELVDAWSRVPGVKLGSCWLVKSDRDDKVQAFSTVCPHLGCGIDWNGKERRFVCPCHDSFFSAEGKALMGPSPRDMDELEVVTSGPDVKVVYRRFRVGLPKKVEV